MSITKTRKTPKRVTETIAMEDLTGTQPVMQRLTREEEDELHNVLESSKDYLPEDTISDTFVPPVQKAKPEPKSTTKKSESQAEVNITKVVAQIVAVGIVAATKKLFGIENTMVLEEAQSIAEPSIRMIARRTDKFMKVVVPLDKLDKEDAKDVELIVTTVTVYIFRLFMQMYQKLMVEKVKKDFEKRGEAPPKFFNSQAEAEQYVKARQVQEDAHMRHETMTKEKRAAIEIATQNIPEGEDGVEYKGNSPLDYL